MVVIRGDAHHKHSVSIFKTRYGGNKVSKTHHVATKPAGSAFIQRHSAINPPRAAAVLVNKRLPVKTVRKRESEGGEGRAPRGDTCPPPWPGLVCGYSVCSDLIPNVHESVGPPCTAGPFSRVKRRAVYPQNGRTRRFQQRRGALRDANANYGSTRLNRSRRELTTEIRITWREDHPPRPVKRMNETASAWCFTFEPFLVQDDGVVLRRLRQAEELTAGTEEGGTGKQTAPLIQ